MDEKKPRTYITIQEFCYRKKIGASAYYALRRAGLGPKETDFDGRLRISNIDEAEWDQQQANPSPGRRAELLKKAERRRERARVAGSRPKKKRQQRR